MPPLFRPDRWWNGWSWRLLLAQWGLLLAADTAFRVAFFVLYRPAFAGASGGELALAFAQGARFDLAVIFAFTGLPALALLLASPWRHRAWVCWGLFALTWAGVVWALVLQTIDLFYYAHVGRRVSFEIHAVVSDWRPIAVLIGRDYPGQALAGLSLIAGLLALAALLFRRLISRPWRPLPWWSQAGQAALLALLTVGLARGGWQQKPLSVGAAFTGPNIALGHLALNGTFTTFEALRDKRHELLRYYPDARALATARAVIGLAGAPADPRFPLLRADPVRAPARRKNLVVIVIESFSAQLTGVLGGTRGVTPRFDALSREGLLFSNFRAAGTRSIEGIAAVLTGYPALPSVALVGSSLEQNGMQSLSRLLKGAGYRSFFLHGAFRGSMWFDRFAERNGFERYIAKEDFPDAEAHSDGTWGIFDGVSLKRLHQELESSPQPVFGFYFSLSSHTPFVLPQEFRPPFAPEVPNARLLNSFAYMDASLGRFFDLARHSGYWRNTVFFITADHNLGGSDLNALERMWTPLLVLDPGDPSFPAGQVSGLLGSQVDIAPTALDLLGISAPNSFVGRSLLRPAARRFALFAWGGQAGWLDEQALVIHDLGKPLALYRYREDPALARNLLPTVGADDPSVRDFQATLQTLNNLLMENRVFPTGPVLVAGAGDGSDAHPAAPHAARAPRAGPPVVRTAAP
ncbi:MAG: LTA synthase family protein [Candidatus Lambdaproteobacteria bacterium]|nr:LTA synthase family protein [Candidatus Lambdaproteobacteria bacterium]